MSSFQVNSMNEYLRTVCVGRNVICKKITQSTMDDARELVDQGCLDGTVIIAETQTKGRGQDGHVWYSHDTGNIYATFIFIRNKSNDDRIGIQDTEFCGSCAVLKGLHDLGLSTARLKWKNDIWCRGHKICGVLVETHPTDITDQAAFLLGIGLNVNSDSRRNPIFLGNATSVKTELNGLSVSKEKLFANVCNYLEICFQTCKKNLLKEMEIYQLFCSGSAVNVHNFKDMEKLYSGILEEVRNDWTCIVKDSEGERHILSDGVSLRPNPSRTIYLWSEAPDSTECATIKSFVDTTVFDVKIISSEKLATDDWMKDACLLVIGYIKPMTDRKLTSRVLEHVRHGGRLLINGEDALRVFSDWLEVKELNITKTMGSPEVAKISYIDVEGCCKFFYHTQTDGMFKIQCRPTGRQKEILATTENQVPVVVQFKEGEGKVVAMGFEIFTFYKTDKSKSSPDCNLLKQTAFERDCFLTNLFNNITLRD